MARVQGTSGSSRGAGEERSEAGRRLPAGAKAIAPAAAILARQDVRSTEEPSGYDLGDSEWGGGGVESKQTETEGGYGYELGDDPLAAGGF
jgi:hypothetical protein